MELSEYYLVSSAKTAQSAIFKIAKLSLCSSELKEADPFALSSKGRKGLTLSESDATMNPVGFAAFTRMRRNSVIPGPMLAPGHKLL